MSYSSLATKCTLSPNFVARTRVIDSVSIHCACSNITTSTMGELYKDKSRQASANYGIGSSGDIACFVDETNASMCTSNTTIDDRSISIMVASTSSSAPYKVSTAAKEALINLLVDICMRNNISDLRWANNAKYGQEAAKGGSVANQNVFIHTWFKSNVVDPGGWMIENLKSIVSDVNEQLSFTQLNKRRIIFIGDNRAKRMHSAVGVDSNLWLVAYKHASDWIQSGATGVYKIEESFNIKSAVCILGGVTDVGYIEPRTYAKTINTYAARWLLRGIPVYFVSVTPVSDSGYQGVTNSAITRFNASMQSALRDDIGYIDAYSAIEDSYTVTGGDNYDANTFKSIYGTILRYARRMNGSIYFNSDLELDPTQFDPYIALFNRNAKVDYHALTNLRVIGALIEAGYRYTQNHTRTKVFDNPNIEAQITALENNNIWYGMYTMCRARSPIEAKIEMEYFRYQLYRHPPRLGAWLNISEFGQDLSFNDSLLRQYNTDLTNLGFTGRMGIIAPRVILKYISWSVWQNEFFLYLVDHIGDLETLNDFLNPWFFSVDAEEVAAGATVYYSPAVVSSTSSTSDTSSSSVIINGQPVNLSESDIKLIGAVVYSEAGGESYDAQLAVANVILNRLKSAYYPNTVSEVIYQNQQFTGTKTKNFLDNETTGGSETSLRAARDAVAGKNNVKDCMGFKFPNAVDLSKTTYHVQYGKIMFFAWLKDPKFR